MPTNLSSTASTATSSETDIGAGAEMKQEQPPKVEKSSGGKNTASAAVDVAKERDPNDASSSSPSSSSESKGCTWIRYEGISEAQGYSLLGICRGIVNMSNVFLSSALLYLASQEAGCLVDDADNLEVDEDCSARVYGFTPSALITNVAVISGLLSAFCMPLIGAILDFTPFRKSVGWGSATIVAVVQLIQIWTNENNWFIMAILQAFVGFVFQVHILVNFSYLPDIARVVEESVMVRFSGSFIFVKYLAQLSFMLLVVGISFGLNQTDVATAQVSQLVSGALLLIVGCFYVWPRFFKHDIEPLRKLPEGQSVLKAGFIQNYNTVRGMYKNYRPSLFWFNVSVMFGEAGIVSILPIYITFCSEVLKMSGAEVGLVFIAALVITMPATRVQRMIYHWTDPKISWTLNFFVASLTSISGAFVLNENNKFLGFVWGVLWGFSFGWHFPTKIMIFSEILPEGQDSEYSGFLIYASQVLSWLPPLLYSLSVEAGMDHHWGLLSLALFSFLGGLAALQMAPWKDLLKLVGRDESVTTVGGTHNGVDDGDMEATENDKQQELEV